MAVNAMKPPGRVPVKSAGPPGAPSHDPGAPVPLVYRLFLWNPDLIMKHLRMMHENGHIEDIPNPWQLTQGLLFYWYRYFFRAQTVGLSKTDKVKNTWRAKLLVNKALRMPFLFLSGAVGQSPDITGLGVTVEYKIRHLIGAYHPGDNAVYDLQLVACYPGKLEELRERLLEVLKKDNSETRWWKDLVIYEGYHERLLAMVEENLGGEFTVAEENAHNPDTSMRVHCRWCCQQPETPAETLKAALRGEYSLAPYA